jgi:hypothetical protein
MEAIEMPRRACYICGRDVLAGQGMYYARRLIHRRCYDVGARSMRRLSDLWAPEFGFRHKRRGVAYEILFLFIGLAISGLFFIVLDAVVSYFETYIAAYYPTAYDTNFYGFITTFWVWWPIFGILFGLAIWGLVGAQQRNVNPYG